jgi:hypothetical protein
MEEHAPITRAFTRFGRRLRQRGTGQLHPAE